MLGEFFNPRGTRPHTLTIPKGNVGASFRLAFNTIIATYGENDIR
jgi:hypothetical protein